jgi:hypothetical protein
MRFTPKTDQQFEQEDKERKEKFLWPRGTLVDYEIISAVSKKSKKGNEMLELSVQVYSPEGMKQTITDYIGEWNLFKLKHICEANGMTAEYEAGEVDANLLYDKVGKAKLGVQKGGENPNGGNYPDRNTIDDYFKEATGAQPRQPITKTRAEMENELNDQIPF